MQYVAKAFLINPAGQILILTRSDTHPTHPLHDDLPGGIVDDGESPDEGMIREIREETGIIVQPQDIQAVASTLHSSSMTYVLYKAILPPDNIKITLSWEHSDYRWQTSEEIIKHDQAHDFDSFFAFALLHVSQLL